jgi:hypothetical protein
MAIATAKQEALWRRQDRAGGIDDMEAVQVQQVMTKDGELVVKGLSYKKGQAVQVIVLAQPSAPAAPPRLTVGRLRRSGLIGMWQDRTDIGDRSTYARRLRERAQ